MTRFALLAASVVAVAVTFTLTARALRRRGEPVRGAAWVAVFGAPALMAGAVEAGLLTATRVHLSAPYALLLGPLLGGLTALRLRALDRRFSPARRRAVWTCALAGLSSATLALAQPEVGRAVDDLTVVVAIDRSRSMSLVPQAEAASAMDRAGAERDMRDGDRLGVLAFGGDAQIEQTPRPRRAPSLAQHVSVSADATDYEAAIGAALRVIPEGSAGRVVLVSDGVETRGDTTAAAARAAARGVRVDYVRLTRPTVNDVRVVSLQAPARADEGEPLELRAVLESTVPADVEVKLSLDGEVVRTTRARVRAGEDVIRLREVARSPGLHRYEIHVATVSPGADLVGDDNDASAFVRVRGASTALVIDGDGATGPIARALESSGFSVEQRGRRGVPASVDGLAPFDVVVLGDVPASELLPAQISALASYARDLGGGLVLMGGDRSLGPGGYGRTPLEEVSPVSFDLKQDGQRAALSEVIIIDYSGSMGAEVGGRTKLDLANEAAARSASLLGAIDRVGVMHVDTVVSWTVPLSPASDRGIPTKIRGVGVGGGGIYTDLSLRAAYGALAHEKSSLKHVLLFADGDDAEQIEGCRELVKGAGRQGVTTSVISLGNGHDTPELEALAKAGGGRFYLIDDAQKLPAVFAQETVLASRSAIHEKAFLPSLGAPSPATRAIGFHKSPPLLGWVTTEAKPRASVLLSAPEGEPLLASWSVGVGRVAVFTSDFKDRWGAQWIKWEGGTQLFTQLARDVARKPENPKMRVSADAQTGDLRIVVDAPGLGFQRLEARARGPHGFAADAPLAAAGGGRYEGTIPARAAGAYAVAIVDTLTGAVVETTGAVSSASREMRPMTDDAAALRAIAAATGGGARASIAGVFRDRPPPRAARASIARPLLFAALLSMLLGVALRRLALPAWLGRRRDATRIASPGPRAAAVLSTLARRASAAKPRGAASTAPSPAAAVAPPAAAPHVPPTADPRSNAGVPPAAAPATPPRPRRAAARSTAERLADRRRSLGA